MAISRTFRYYLLRFKRLQGSSRSLALGSAIGAAVGITPTIPLHNALILAFALLFRVNPIAGILAGTIISNPLTIPPQYFLCWKIGDFFLPGRLTWERIRELLELIQKEGIMDSLDLIHIMGMDAVMVMMLGGLVLAVPAGIFTYIVVYRFFSRMRQKKRARHLLNNPSR